MVYGYMRFVVLVGRLGAMVIRWNVGYALLFRSNERKETNV